MSLAFNSLEFFRYTDSKKQEISLVVRHIVSVAFDESTAKTTISMSNGVAHILDTPDNAMYEQIRQQIVRVYN